jgi:uncharacterized protein YecE (DUF72 family)
MKKDILIGCSSYNNRFWKGVFYPENLPTSRWFDYYCQHFNTYEMNGTFYKAPTIRVMDNWYKKTPDHFIFSVKAPKEITHIKKFIDCADTLSEFYKVCETGLKEKLGPILFQFPPSYDFTTERLHNIINNLDTNFQNVIEFRHKSWWHPEVFESLKFHKISFCSVSYPGLPEDILTDFPFTYIRFHGSKKLFYSRYSSEELENVKKQITDKSGFVYFNNTASDAGILNALEFSVKE